MGPGTAVVGYAVALGEGGFVGELLAVVEFRGERVNVGLAVMEVADLIPCRAVNAYAYKAF